MALSLSLSAPTPAFGAGVPSAAVLGNRLHPMPRGVDVAVNSSIATSYSLYSTLVTSEYVFTVPSGSSEPSLSLHSTPITFEYVTTIPIYITKSSPRPHSTSTTSKSSHATSESQSITSDSTTSTGVHTRTPPSTKPSNSPTPTLSKSRGRHTQTVTSSTSSTSSTTDYSIATQFTVGAPPSLCTSSKYAYETKLSAPTGWVIIAAGGTGWGTEGSNWTFSTGNGARLTEMTAKCQGSICTNIAGDNEEENGKMNHHADGSWSLTVTPNMQGSLLVMGILLKDEISSSASPSASPSSSNASQKRRRRKVSPSSETFPLEVIGVPPCDLEIAKNCSNSRAFDTVQQWEAYRVDDYLKSYLKKHDIKSHAGLLSRTQKDFVSDMDTAGKTCDVSEGTGYNCAPPGTDTCLVDSDYDSSRGYLMANAVVEFGFFLSRIHQSATDAGNRIGDYIDSIVADYFTDAATQTWNKILNVVSSVVGVLVGVFIALDFLTGPEWTVWLIAIAAGISAALGLAGNTGGLLDPGTTDAQFDKAASYQTQADNLVNEMKSAITGYFNNETTQDDIYTVYEGGNWISGKVQPYFDKQDFFANATDWYERQLIAHFIVEAFQDNNIYILFVPYDDDKKYHLKTTKFNDQMCKDHWVNDPSWKYDAWCGMQFGPDGESGMALLTRPSSLGSESKSWGKNSLNYEGENITTWDIMASAIWGQQEHGFNYSYANQNWTDVLANDGVSYAKSLFSSLGWTTPGLFDLPVCVIEDLVYVPGVDQVMMDIHDNQNKAGYSSSTDPCSCGDYTYKSPDGKSGKFTDFVSTKVKDSFGSKCRVWAADRSPEADWVSGSG
ncbi:uncharacterized protein N7459_006977 [Penicillium hispanicum]|uniref:uncharacterized protein n=1 Tax=Penicillium hispanicum TaxID=1080232 RepID=UPI0025424C5F|nr:uncharacterized protein N7459_006977 [Penicillium hispanicum]KAJ5578013.1 hypothetical protein N7459_006977 [Penicillium hispanicum]